MVLPTLAHEQLLYDQGLDLIAGVDEVGRGSWVGPVVAGAVILPKNCTIPKYLRDSKLLSHKQRVAVHEEIVSLATAYSVGLVEVEIINRVGIGKATQLAFRRALGALAIRPKFVLIDAFYIEKLSKKVQKPIIGGDKVSASIAAASIVAKVFRDDLLTQLHKECPDYDWATNKGYGTKAHRDVIASIGLSKYHRKSFAIGW